MDYIFMMSLRNTLRNRRRSLLAIISVALSSLLIVYTQGFIGGFLESMVKNITKNETGHIRISTMEFAKKSEFMSISENLENPDEIMALIRADKEISIYIDLMTKRINFGVLLSNKGNNKTALALAGEQEIEKKLTGLAGSIQAGGRYLQHKKEMIIGSSLADALNYKLGDKVKVMTQGSDYALHLKKFTIVGIFQTGLNILDEKFFQIRLDDAQHLLRMDHNVQQIIIMLKDYQNSEIIAQRLNFLLKQKNLVVEPWSRISSNYDYIRMVSGITNWFFMFIAFLGAIIIGNIMMMVVMERRHEIGILKSLGISRGRIMLLFVLEGMILGFIGSVTGVFLGSISIYLININGFDLTTMMKGVEGFPMDNILYFQISIIGLVKFIAMGTLVSALITIKPSRKAAKLSVVNSLKSV